jgi:hypothetical protein
MLHTKHARTKLAVHSGHCAEVRNGVGSIVMVEAARALHSLALARCSHTHTRMSTCTHGHKAARSMLLVAYSILHVAHCTFHAARSMFHVARCASHVAHHARRAICYMPHLACICKPLKSCMLPACVADTHIEGGGGGGKEEGPGRGGGAGQEGERGQGGGRGGSSRGRRRHAKVVQGVSSPVLT